VRPLHRPTSYADSCRVKPSPGPSSIGRCQWSWVGLALLLKYAANSLGWAQFVSSEMPLPMNLKLIWPKAVGGLLYKALTWTLNGQYKCVQQLVWWILYKPGSYFPLLVQQYTHCALTPCPCPLLLRRNLPFTFMLLWSRRI